MRQMTFSNGRTEFSFWGNAEYATNAVAKAERDLKARELRRAGYAVRTSVLRDQCRKYSGLGEPDGTVGHVYKVEATPMHDGTDAPQPLEARDALIEKLRTRAPRPEIEAAADAYREAIRQLGLRTGRRLPIPSRAFIIRFLG